MFAYNRRGQGYYICTLIHQKSFQPKNKLTKEIYLFFYQFNTEYNQNSL